MNTVNQLTICRDRFDEDFEFEEAIQNAIMLLLKTGYIMTVRYDEPGLGIVCIEYDHDNLELGGCYPYWVSPDEEIISCKTEEDEE